MITTHSKTKRILIILKAYIFIVIVFLYLLRLFIELVPNDDIEVRTHSAVHSSSPRRRFMPTENWGIVFERQIDPYIDIDSKL